MKHLFTRHGNFLLEPVRYILHCMSLLVFILLYEYFYRIMELPEITMFLLLCSTTFMITIFLTTLFHEMGHLVFGFLTNYRFGSIQLFHCLLFSKNNKLVFKVVQHQPVIAQCIMIPPLRSSYIPPFLLYNLGGLIFNFLQFIFSMLFLPVSTSIYLTFFLYHLCIQAISSIVYNVAPSKGFQTINDGKIVFSLIKDDPVKQAYYWHLRFQNDLQNGSAPGEQLNSPYFKEHPLLEMNLFTFDNQLIKYYGYLENRQFLQAKEALIPLFENAELLSKQQKNQLNAEYTFIQTTFAGEDENFELSNDLLRFLQATLQPFAYRILVIYYHLSGSKQQSQKYLAILQKIMVCPTLSSLVEMEYQLAVDWTTNTKNK